MTDLNRNRCCRDGSARGTRECAHLPSSYMPASKQKTLSGRLKSRPHWRQSRLRHKSSRRPNLMHISNVRYMQT